ncbi:MAG: M48 family metalloprotease [Nanoarchaeota archaeon]
MIEEALHLYLARLLNPVNLGVLIISLLLSFFFYILFRKTDKIKVKVTYLYSHIFLLFFPFLFSAFLAKCTSAAYSCVFQCSTPLYLCSPELLIYLVTAGIGATFLLSFLLLPYLYTWSSKSKEIKEGVLYNLVHHHSSSLVIAAPRLYAVNDLKPVAYSITNVRPAIFISVGLCELLSRQELEAVLLHELYHIKNKTSFWRFSTHVLKIFSPLSTFISLHSSISKEEREADAFAVQEQGTEQYLRSTKEKITQFTRAMQELI